LLLFREQGTLNREHRKELRLKAGERVTFAGGLIKIG
jgi:hypothetical protein